jgi:hypothetical protein
MNPLIFVNSFVAEIRSYRALTPTARIIFCANVVSESAVAYCPESILVAT